MKNFEKLSRAEMKNVLGGATPVPFSGSIASCTASCGSSGSSVECDNVTSCIATDNVGCEGADSKGNIVSQKCKTNVG